MNKTLIIIAIIFSIGAPLILFALGKIPLWFCIIFILLLLLMGVAEIQRMKALRKFSKSMETGWKSGKKNDRFIVALIIVLGLLLWVGFMTFRNVATSAPLTQNNQNITKTTYKLTATPISGVAPLEVKFSGTIISPDPHTVIVLDRGENQYIFNGNLIKNNYCTIGLTGMKGNNVWQVNPEFYTYQTPGTYVAKLRKGVNCSGPAVCCTPGDVVATITINVK